MLLSEEQVFLHPCLGEYRCVPQLLRGASKSPRRYLSRWRCNRERQAHRPHNCYPHLQSRWCIQSSWSPIESGLSHNVTEGPLRYIVAHIPGHADGSGEHCMLVVTMASRPTNLSPTCLLKFPDDFSDFYTTQRVGWGASV